MRDSNEYEDGEEFEEPEEPVARSEFERSSRTASRPSSTSAGG